MAIMQKGSCSSKALNSLRTNKSPETDNVMIELIIWGKDELVGPLLKIFNLVFRSGAYPAQWSTSILKPIHKKGSLSDPDNYKGIAVS